MNVVRDRIARRAAALVASGDAVDVDTAIHQAAHQLGFVRGAPLPAPSEVRRHLQGIAQESLGDAGYRAAVAAHFALAAHVMALLERAFAGPTLLCGRGARGQFDGGAELHLRLYARAPLHAIAQLLVDAGFAEPAFETVETRHGRANRLRIDHEGTLLCVMRCLPEWWESRDEDLVTGRRTAVLALEQVRERAGDAPE